MSFSRFLNVSLSGYILLAVCSKSHALPASCLHNSAYRGFAPLVIPARVYGPKDRRKELTPAVEKTAGFTKDEVRQLGKMIGSLVCPAEPAFKLAVATAFVMGNDKQIFTAGHVVTAEDGRVRNLAKCKFINFASPRETFELDAKSPRNLLPTWSATVGGGRYDRARLTLKKAVRGA